MAAALTPHEQVGFAPNNIAKMIDHTQALSILLPLQAINDAQDYDRAVQSLQQLLDAGAADEAHPLAILANMLGGLISDYETIHYPQTAVSPLATLQLLMQQHALSQSDLPEIGSQGVVSEVLNGKRELNLRQIKALAKRFNVPVGVFIE